METVAAISTPLAASGLGIIRISGDNAIDIGEKMFKPASNDVRLSNMAGYTCALGMVADLERDIDEAIVTVFRAPKSYTGEDTVEFSCHGSPTALKRVLRLAYASGAVPAPPGEFTKRAFLNGKMSLTEAEAVMDIISARNLEAGKAAIAVKEGALHKKICNVIDELTALQSHFAAWADFPEEDVPILNADDAEAVLKKQSTVLKSLIDNYDNGKIIKNGIGAVIVGKPNVGKSTLMNLLSGCERSIVTDVAGTTRDIVEESVTIGSIPIRLSDTAGLHNTMDPVEKIGVGIAKSALERSDVVIAVFDSSLPLDEDDKELIESLTHKPTIAVLNKSDLPPIADIDFISSRIDECIRISALEGEGIETLRSSLEKVLRIADYDPATPLMASERQLCCAKKALSALDEALNALALGITYDAVSICIESSLEALCELTGQNASEAVVDEVFSRFCVGK